MAPIGLRLAALVALCLFVPALVSASELQGRRFTIEEAIAETGAIYNEEKGRFAWWNETVEDPLAEEHADRRSTLRLGDSSPVTVTFYDSPGMYCTDGEGQCGYGTDTNGRARGPGGDFLQTSLYPLHAASGHFEHLGGCGACGILSEGGINLAFVITDVTDALDELGNREWPPFGSHIDLCLPEFRIYRPGTRTEQGGIFTGTWTRINCNTMGAPNMPSGNIVVRLQEWNQWAKAVVISRLGATGEIIAVDFYTAQDRNGGNSGNGNRVVHTGFRVQGWGAWWSPNSNLGGQGGVGLRITVKGGQVLDTNGFPMPDYSLWHTGDIINIFQNVS
ncbi:hypothetical protein KFL_000420070 [Klebsormidium nitens]|uniref:Expansin-like EG45 domain-containing protein n=1 Tax=Klebsormidium nitens TaxID=105231 RepID=A0A1Y1HMS8_KLENI|nr:hypothetical protein KFL_000420070 [Klebsormidium nitens]|eukprot:GAQ79935.1 hypothetical protein KFL_000420070 [Klebsormidium nitens]